nr:MAG TPA: hypothetical protein [Caudoviricetes sp.]
MCSLVFVFYIHNVCLSKLPTLDSSKLPVVAITKGAVLRLHSAVL